MDLVVIEAGPLTGPENMALDEKIAALASAGHGPFLRLYAWRGPWVSLGWFQDADAAVDVARARALGVGIVRRPSGGKAILHDGDLTYAVALPPAHPVAQLGVARAHRILARPIVVALRALGIDARLAPDAVSPGRATVPCFLEKAAESVVVGDRKLAGAAQLRRGGALLEHGSIPISEPAPERLAVLSGLDSHDARAAFLERTTWVAREAPGVTRAALEAALASSFRAALEPGPIDTDSEQRPGVTAPCRTR